MRPSTGPVTAIRSSRAGPRTPVGARRRLARPPSRTPTRGPTAWGENGRARSSNRLKPAVTWCPACPCGLGRSMVPSPLQGACGFSPGLQPRAHSVIGIRTLATVVIAGPGGPAGQAAPDPYRTGIAPTRRARMPDGGRLAYPCRGEAPPRPPRSRRGNLRGAQPARLARETHRQSRTACSLPALPGWRVTHRLTPTGWGVTQRPHAHRSPRRWTIPHRGQACRARPVRGVGGSDVLRRGGRGVIRRAACRRAVHRCAPSAILSAAETVGACTGPASRATTSWPARSALHSAPAARCPCRYL